MTFCFELLKMTRASSMSFNLWHALAVTAVLLLEAHGLGEVSLMTGDADRLGGWVENYQQTCKQKCNKTQSKKEKKYIYPSLNLFKISWIPLYRILRKKSH